MRRARWLAAMAVVLGVIGPSACGDGGSEQISVPPLTEDYWTDVYMYVADDTNYSDQFTTIWLYSRGPDEVRVVAKVSDEMADECTARFEGRATGSWDMEVTGGQVNQNQTDNFQDDPHKPATGWVTLWDSGDWIQGEVQVGMVSGCRYEFSAKLKTKTHLSNTGTLFSP